MLIRANVDDPAQLKAYQAATPPIVEKYRGKLIVRSGVSIALEEPAESRRLVVMEFPALSDAEAFYHSREYSEARKLREDIGSFEFVAVDRVK
jgi:uncharacterized protein (DUF1330 family)